MLNECHLRNLTTPDFPTLWSSQILHLLSHMMKSAVNTQQTKLPIGYLSL